MPYTDKNLNELIDSLSKEFNVYLGKAEDANKSLAKSEAPAFMDKDKKNSKKIDEDHKEHAEPKAEHEEHKEAHEEHEKPEHKEHAEHEEHAAPEHAEHCDYDDEDMDHMHKMYMSMHPSELHVHHEAIRKCMEHHGLAKCEDVEEDRDAEPLHGGSKEGADSTETSADEVHKSESEDGISASEPKGAKGPESPASKAGHATEIKKSEVERRNGGKIEAAAPKDALGAKSPASATGDATEIKKSESYNTNELLKAENTQLKKNLEAVEGFLTKLVEKTAPPAKAVYSMSAIAKSEATSEDVTTLTKSEVTSILSRKAAGPLSVSDRQAINKFYDLGATNINSIKHLLK